jgi:hypothetical protein
MKIRYVFASTNFQFGCFGAISISEKKKENSEKYYICLSNVYTLRFVVYDSYSIVCNRIISTRNVVAFCGVCSSKFHTPEYESYKRSFSPY